MFQTYQVAVKVKEILLKVLYGNIFELYLIIMFYA